MQALLEDPDISDGNSASSAAIGSLSSAAMLGFSSLAGPLVRRHGARATTSAGACLAGLGLGLASTAPSLPLLAAAYGGVAGVGFALAWAPSVVVVGAYFTGSRRAVASGLAVAGSGVGTVVLAQVAAHRMRPAIPAAPGGTMPDPTRPPPRTVTRGDPHDAAASRRQEAP